MLHVTNGDCAATILKRAALEGQVLAWRDVLHDGPAPQGLTDAELRGIRARFIADCGWQSFAQALASFARRDRILRKAVSRDEIVLWFEHDLYDQLQLIQILSRLYVDGAYARGAGETNISLICIGSFAGISDFHGLGQLDEQQMASLFPLRKEVSPSQFQLAHKAWKAFRAPTPEALNALVKVDSSEDQAEMPFLRAALRRHLQEYPGLDGVSRTQRHALEAVWEGQELSGAPQPFTAIFQRSQRLEAVPFLGDTAFQLRLNALASGEKPLLQITREQSTPHYALTEQGQQVLNKRAFWSDPAPRWLGGVQLTSRSGWRWNEDLGQVVATNA